MTKFSLLRKAEIVLEWDVLLQFLSKHASSEIGKSLCQKLHLAQHLDEAEQGLGETSEMLELQRTQASFTIDPFPDLRPMLTRIQKGGMLEASEFRQISVVLGQIMKIKANLKEAQEFIPLLYRKAGVLNDHQQIKGLIDHCVDNEGNIRSSATLDLKNFSFMLQASRERIRKRIDVMLSKPAILECLQEKYFDLRANRYVLPVKTEYKGRIPGIVHDVSTSGATIFIEPRELVELNNQMKVSELEVEREIRKILHDLAEKIFPHTTAIVASLLCLAELDCIAAKATVSHLLDANTVTLNTQGDIQLNQARHPLLVLSRLSDRVAGSHAEGTTKDSEVIANDIHITREVRGLVISGPNAGGKTVTLKLLGLFSLMVRAGLHLPCSTGSIMGFFSEIYADIGDAQDLSRDLSSFSAHITFIIGLLKHATPGGIILLDEPATSTDPTEGAALAEALLIRLANAGMKVVITTHYPSLKLLAQSSQGFLNASAEFDIATLSPTYRVLFGMPGRSSAIDIAGRLGMDEALLEDALDRVAHGGIVRDEQSITKIVDELQDQQRELEKEMIRAKVAREESEYFSKTQRAITTHIQQAERELKKKARKKINEEFSNVKQQIHQLLKDIKKENSKAALKKAREQLGKIEFGVKEKFSDLTVKVPIEQLQVDDQVEIIPLGVVGTLCELPGAARRARVRIGERVVSVDVGHLGGRVELGHKEEKLEQTTEQEVILSHNLMELGEDVLDVRGKYADQAVYEVEMFLDKASLLGMALIRVIHGHGTGKLKQVLRKHLKASPYVVSFRPGHQNEGGDGITIVSLK